MGSRPYPFDHLAAVRQLRAGDAAMAALIGRVGRFQLALERHPRPLDSLLTAIVYQQLHATAAAAILARLRDQIGGGRYPSPPRILAASDEALRATGLSRQKIAAVRDLAEKAAAGVIPAWSKLERLEDEAIIERLTTVRGIGPWTVQMLLMFRLGRPDVLPIHDYGVQQGYQLAYGTSRLPTPRELAAAGEAWRPWRSVASWYLWQAVRLAREPQRAGVRGAARGGKG
jgi:DNA-3-methyladenine glycosylase II